jgi:hypothetical protein
MRPLFSYLGILLGICALAFFATQCRLLHRLHFVFQETTGKVIGATIEERYSEGGVDPNGIPVGGGTAYVPHIIYEYRVAGISYRGTRYNLSQTGRSMKWAKSILELYPIGTTVAVFYSPQNPSRSVLTKWLSWDFYVTFLFGSLLVGIVCISGSVFALRRSKKQ